MKRKAPGDDDNEKGTKRQKTYEIDCLSPEQATRVLAKLESYRKMWWTNCGRQLTASSQEYIDQVENNNRIAALVAIDIRKNPPDKKKKFDFGFRSVALANARLLRTVQGTFDHVKLVCAVDFRLVFQQRYLELALSSVDLPRPCRQLILSYLEMAAMHIKIIASPCPDGTPTSKTFLETAIVEVASDQVEQRFGMLDTVVDSAPDRQFRGIFTYTMSRRGPPERLASVCQESFSDEHVSDSLWEACFEGLAR